MRAIIIDDEIGAREVLQGLLARFASDIEVVATASNLLAGVDLIREYQPHVVFLDIQMPNYFGYEIDKFFEDMPFEIIFTTAHDEYAVKAFELAALDYLLKPIDIDRFQQSIQRLRLMRKHESLNNRIQTFQNIINEDFPTKITLLDRGIHFTVDLTEIVAVEGQSSYSKIYLVNGKSFTQSRNLKQMGRLLGDHPCFYRCHKSWMVNKEHVVEFSKGKQRIRLNAGVEAKLSRDKIEEFSHWITK